MPEPTEVQLKIARSATSIMALWVDLIRRSNGDCWYQVHARQAFQDSLRAMEHHKLIDDFDIEKFAVKVDGIWIQDDRRITL